MDDRRGRPHIDWAHTYDGYRRLAASPQKLERLLTPARNSFASHDVIPDWCGVDFLRGWAFYLARADRHVGDDTLGPEWAAVLQALTVHPDSRLEDRPPPPPPSRSGADRGDLHVPLPTSFSTAPKRHKDVTFLEAKRARLWEPHVAPINGLVDKIREQIQSEVAAQTLLGQETPHVFVPYVDPDSGGAQAHVLFILESPAGPAALGSGMLSADNNDETAKNIWQVYEASGMPRTHGLHWNAVPWYVGDGKKNAAVSHAQVEHGRQYLLQLLDVAPDIAVVLALGKPAQKSILGAAAELTARRVHVINAPHPSPRLANSTKGESLLKVNAAVAEALAIVGLGGGV
jgi:uracil-DNA glycosylase